jgi:acyl-CoA synthetase (AMP-forming)/AMP-acid ligase II
VARYPDRPALTLWGQQLTYRELDEAVERLAETLAPMGSRVAVLAPNVPAFAVGLLAAWRLGAVVIPLSARLREYEIRRILEAAEASSLVSLESHRGYSFLSLIRRLIPQLPSLRACMVVDPFGRLETIVENETAVNDGEPMPKEIAGILYTSGSTGEPKGALVLHEREVAGALHLKEALDLSQSDVSVLVVPMAHAFGMTCLLTTFASAGHGILVESTLSVEPVHEALSEFSGTVCHGPPALFASLSKMEASVPASLRTGLVAGAPCPASLIQGLDAVGARILNVFGMTEAGAVTACRLHDPPEVRYTTCGSALPGYDLRIATQPESAKTMRSGLPSTPSSADGHEESGEVQIRGPYITPGYYQSQSETAAAFADGWFRTGDVGSLDRQGHLRISGRIKDVVQVAGLSVFPAEVEGFLGTHPDVVEAAVVGVPHETMGEALEAFVVARPGSRLGVPELLRFARENIAGYKLPYAIHLVPELPHLPSGKPDRRMLTQALASGAGSSMSALTAQKTSG